jgi:hypothetical protein
MRGCANVLLSGIMALVQEGIHPADATSLDFALQGAFSSATQQAPELFRISLCGFSLRDWRDCLLCHDSADGWTTVFTCLILLVSRSGPCLTKSYTCLINDVSVGFCYLSVSIRLPGGPDSYSPPALWSKSPARTRWSELLASTRRLLWSLWIEC